MEAHKPLVLGTQVNHPGVFSSVTPSGGVGSHPGDALPRASLPPSLLVPVFGSWHMGLCPWGSIQHFGGEGCPPPPVSAHRILRTFLCCWGLGGGLCSSLFELHCVARGPGQELLTVQATRMHSPAFPGTGAPCYSYSITHIFPLDSTHGLIFEPMTSKAVIFIMEIFCC